MHEGVIAKSLVRERARTGLSLAEVARRAGIAKSTLSQLESGNGNPSLETLWALCVALDIPFAQLLEPQAQKTQVLRRGEGTKVVAEQAHYQAILLATCPPGARRDIYLLLTCTSAPMAIPDGPYVIVIVELRYDERIHRGLREGRMMSDDTKELEVNPGKPKYIQTIKGIGYRFNKEV